MGCTERYKYILTYICIFIVPICMPKKLLCIILLSIFSSCIVWHNGNTEVVEPTNNIPVRESELFIVMDIDPTYLESFDPQMQSSMKKSFKDLANADAQFIARAIKAGKIYQKVSIAPLSRLTQPGHKGEVVLLGTLLKQKEVEGKSLYIVNAVFSGLTVFIWPLYAQDEMRYRFELKEYNPASKKFETVKQKEYVSTQHFVFGWLTLPVFWLNYVVPQRDDFLEASAQNFLH